MTEDDRLYSSAKDYVRRCFSDDYNKSENTLIVSISRKGPKFLEMLFDRENPETLNTITEVALPFCLRKKAGKKLNMKVFDDAIYFGTTAEGIIRELKAFEEMYQIEADNSLYTAIRAKESRQNFGAGLEKVACYSYNDENKIDLRKGYGHYFIRRFERDFSAQGNTMEVEFPLVEFSCSPFNQDRLFEELRSCYGQEYTYIVENYRQRSLSVVLKEDSWQAFRKIRVYCHGNIVRVIGMAPWLLPNDMSVIASMFAYTPIMKVWSSLMDSYSSPMADKAKQKAYAYMQTERCIRKSLVIMANYLLSFELLLAEKDKIVNAISRIASSYRYDGVRMTDLFYLLGDEDLCRQIKDLFAEMWSNAVQYDRKQLITPNLKVQDEEIDYQVFEHSDVLDKKEQEIFKQRNTSLLENCKDEHEALSVLFYNQTSLIEKWSRVHNKYDFGRLRFGYTYQSLQKDLKQKYGDKGAQALKMNIHQWMDKRIGQACVVPQYIIDTKTNLWVRVFRPGENEEALISHMARYVIAVYRAVERVMRMGWVNDAIFRELLCLSAIGGYKDQLDDTFEFELIPNYDDKTLLYRYGLQGVTSDVLDFMINMKIFELNNHMLTISRELNDEEMTEATTLDKSLQKEIETRVSSIMQQIVDGKYEKYTFFVTNLYFVQSKDLESLARMNAISLDTLGEIVSLIERGEPQKAYADLVSQDYYRSQKYVVSNRLLSNNSLLSQLPFSAQELSTYKSEMVKLWMIKFTYELIIVTYLHTDPSHLAQEVATDVQDLNLYGNLLELDATTRTNIREAIASDDDMNTLRLKMLPIIKERIEKIPQTII